MFLKERFCEAVGEMLVTLGKKNCHCLHHAIAYEMEMVRYCVVTWPCNATSDTVSRRGRLLLV